MERLGDAGMERADFPGGAGMERADGPGGAGMKRARLGGAQVKREDRLGGAQEERAAAGKRPACGPGGAAMDCADARGSAGGAALAAEWAEEAPLGSWDEVFGTGSDEVWADVGQVLLDAANVARSPPPDGLSVGRGPQGTGRWEDILGPDAEQAIADMGATILLKGLDWATNGGAFPLIPFSSRAESLFSEKPLESAAHDTNNEYGLGELTAESV